MEEKNNQNYILYRIKRYLLIKQVIQNIGERLLKNVENWNVEYNKAYLIIQEEIEKNSISIDLFNDFLRKNNCQYYVKSLNEIQILKVFDLKSKFTTEALRSSINRHKKNLLNSEKRYDYNFSIDKESINLDLKNQIDKRKNIKKSVKLSHERNIKNIELDNFNDDFNFTSQGDLILSNSSPFIIIPFPLQFFLDIISKYRNSEENLILYSITLWLAIASISIQKQIISYGKDNYPKFNTGIPIKFTWKELMNNCKYISHRTYFTQVQFKKFKIALFDLLVSNISQNNNLTTFSSSILNYAKCNIDLNKKGMFFTPEFVNSEELIPNECTIVISFTYSNEPIKYKIEKKEATPETLTDAEFFNFVKVPLLIVRIIKKAKNYIENDPNNLYSHKLNTDYFLSFILSLFFKIVYKSIKYYTIMKARDINFVLPNATKFRSTVRELLEDTDFKNLSQKSKYNSIKQLLFYVKKILCTVLNIADLIIPEENINNDTEIWFVVNLSAILKTKDYIQNRYTNWRTSNNYIPLLLDNLIDIEEKNNGISKEELILKYENQIIEIQQKIPIPYIADFYYKKDFLLGNGLILKPYLLKNSLFNLIHIEKAQHYLDTFLITNDLQDLVGKYLIEFFEDFSLAKRIKMHSIIIRTYSVDNDLYNKFYLYKSYFLKHINLYFTQLNKVHQELEKNKFEEFIGLLKIRRDYCEQTMNYNFPLNKWLMEKKRCYYYFYPKGFEHSYKFSIPKNKFLRTCYYYEGEEKFYENFITIESEIQLANKFPTINSAKKLKIEKSLRHNIFLTESKRNIKVTAKNKYLKTDTLASIPSMLALNLLFLSRVTYGSLERNIFTLEILNFEENIILFYMKNFYSMNPFVGTEEERKFVIDTSLPFNFEMYSFLYNCFENFIKSKFGESGWSYFLEKINFNIFDFIEYENSILLGRPSNLHIVESEFGDAFKLNNKKKLYDLISSTTNLDNLEYNNSCYYKVNENIKIMLNLLNHFLKTNVITNLFVNFLNTFSSDSSEPLIILGKVIEGSEEMPSNYKACYFLECIETLLIEALVEDVNSYVSDGILLLNIERKKVFCACPQNFDIGSLKMKNYNKLCEVLFIGSLNIPLQSNFVFYNKENLQYCLPSNLYHDYWYKDSTS